MTRLPILAAAAFAVIAVPATGQTSLTRNQIVQTLYQTEGTVARFDPMAVQQEAERRAAQGGGNASGPISDQLKSLPQLSLEINFHRGSARITPESYYTVGLIADALHTPYLMGERLLIVGHTDATGSRETNLELSKRRAKSVYDALTTTFNVPAGQVAAIGLGEEQLQDPANPNSGVNRRVQIINMGE